MRSGIASAAALALILVGGAAVARDLPTGGFTVGDVAAWLQAKGYQTAMITGSDGKVHVQTALDGVKLGVYMFDCQAGRCGSMQFSVGFATHGKFDPTRMNEWNRDSRWARGYFDNVNDPWIEYDVDLSPGAIYEMLDDEFATYRSSLARFVKLYGLQ